MGRKHKTYANNVEAVKRYLHRKHNQELAGQSKLRHYKETKETWIWIKGLPLLKPTDIVSGRENKIWKMPPSEDRSKLRSKTYSGIAAAIANQYSKS